MAALPTQTQRELEFKVDKYQAMLVLISDPSNEKNYPLNDAIVQSAKNSFMSIYSPHTFVRSGVSLQIVLRDTISEAIPRSKAVIMNLTTLTRDERKMIIISQNYQKPFLLICDSSSLEHASQTVNSLRINPNCRGEISYSDVSDAQKRLESLLPNLVL